jgi:hypothetical protein
VRGKGGGIDIGAAVRLRPTHGIQQGADHHGRYPLALAGRYVGYHLIRWTKLK